MDGFGEFATTEQMRRDGLTSGTRPTLVGVADRLRDEVPPEGPVSAERVAALFRRWLSGAECLAALLTPGQEAIREFLLGVQRARRGCSTALVPSALEAVKPAPEEPIPLIGRLQKSSHNPPPLEALSEGDFPPQLCLPPPHLPPPHALGLDGLASGCATSTGNAGGESGGDGAFVEVLEAALPAAKR
ncbi:hypothetical protein ACSSS7_007737 [Eimeria intestinalis]